MENLYTVVSQLNESPNKWAIMGDFLAQDENEATQQAISRVEKWSGPEMMTYNSFLKDSEELSDFIRNNDFVD